LTSTQLPEWKQAPETKAFLGSDRKIDKLYTINIKQ